MNIRKYDYGHTLRNIRNSRSNSRYAHIACELEYLPENYSSASQEVLEQIGMTDKSLQIKSLERSIRLFKLVVNMLVSTSRICGELLVKTEWRPKLLAECTELFEYMPEENTGIGFVYFLCLNGDVVYVGQTIKLASRIRTHARGVKAFDRVLVMPTSRSELNKKESYFIRKLNPTHNKTHKNCVAIS